MEQDKRIAVIGLGNMGGGMAHRLVTSGYQVTVFNRTEAKTRPLVDAGAKPAGSALEATRDNPVVLLSLSDETVVESVYFGQIADELPTGTIVIDTSTVSPAYAIEAAKRMAERGVHRVEAVVIGNPQQARNGEMRVFTAGDEEAAQTVNHVLATIGNDVRHVGEAGRAAALKVVFNLVLGAQVASLAEATSYGMSAGLDRDQLLGFIAESGFSSAVMRFRAQLMRQHRYEPAFFRTTLMDKDLRIALRSDGGQETRLPVLDSVQRQFAAIVAAGDGDKDAAVIVEHLTRQGNRS
jgi:3-hydroxyisobutyrate dehydrogenase-like beta-hydroxyacid dehydrogenase